MARKTKLAHSGSGSGSGPSGPIMAIMAPGPGGRNPEEKKVLQRFLHSIFSKCRRKFCTGSIRTLDVLYRGVHRYDIFTSLFYKTQTLLFLF